jgi:hypothetical protein
MKDRLELPLYVVRIRAKAEEPGPDNPVIGCSVYDNDGEYLTKALPESVCNELVKICNAYYCEQKQVTKGRAYGSLLFYANIPISPMAKPESQVVSLDKNDCPIVCDSPHYTRYISQFISEITLRNATAYADLPIGTKSQIRCEFHCDNKQGKSLPAYVDAALDCLVAAGIIKSKGHFVVNNTDGSRIYPDMDNPRVAITIRRWSES